MKKKVFIIKAVLFFLILSLSNFSYGYLPMKVTSDIRNYIGTWENIDKKTKGIKKIIIFSKNKKSMIHVYAACKTKTCDWGVFNAKGYTVRFSDNPRSARYIKASYETCITRKNLRIQKDNEKLKISTHVAYIDNSRRQSHYIHDEFVRVKNSIEKIKPIVKLSATQQKAKCEAERKRSPVVKLTQEELKEKRLKEWYAAHPKQKTPQSVIAKNLPKQCGHALFYGKVKYHKGYKIYYLQGQDQRTPNEEIIVQLRSGGFNMVSLLGKYIIVSPGGRIIGGSGPLPGFSRRFDHMRLLQVVKGHKVDYKALKQKCSKIRME